MGWTGDMGGDWGQEDCDGVCVCVYSYVCVCFAAVRRAELRFACGRDSTAQAELGGRIGCERGAPGPGQRQDRHQKRRRASPDRQRFRVSRRHGA